MNLKEIQKLESKISALNSQIEKLYSKNKPMTQFERIWVSDAFKLVKFYLSSKKDLERSL